MLTNLVRFLFLIFIFVNGEPRQPIRDAARRFGNLPGRAGERKADPSPAVDRVEVEAGGHRDPGLDQETATKLLAVARYARNIGIKVERSFGGREPGESTSRKRADQQIAIGAIASDMAVELAAAAEYRDRRKLRQRRRGYVEILCETLDRASQIRRHQHPAEPPPGHAEVF